MCWSMVSYALMHQHNLVIRNTIRQQHTKHTMAEINNKSTGRMVILNFANDNAPVVKEYSGKDYIQFGEKNDYSDFIISLYNRSAKHNAIINGKVNYIVG